MLHFPNAKINLGLYVTNKRIDGYHDLETVFYPLPQLKDALEVLPTADNVESSMRISGKAIEGDVYDNLVWSAFQLIKSHYPERVSNINVQLLKAIPMGAGLGGGSSDGAFMLRLLNKFFALELSDKTLADYALQLGSDCPFFIYNTPHFASGRGEVLSPIDVDLSRYSIQIICPKIHVATAVAFGGITPQAATFDLRTLTDLSVEDWKGVVINDFEQTVFAKYAGLRELKEQLYAEGAIYASMSGSGSTIYGIFEKGKQSSLTTNTRVEVFYCE